MSFIGNSFTNQSFVPQVDYFNGNASNTSFTLSRSVGSVYDIQAVIENVPQNPASAFTVSGNVITFTSAPPSGTNNIYVRYTSPTTQVIKPAQGTVGPTEINSSYSLWNLSSANVSYSAGNVGIGTDSPATGLHVNKDWVSSYGSINISHSTNSLGGIGIRCNNVYKGGFLYRGGSAGAYLDIITNDAEPVVFSTSSTERMRIDSAGKVGIGVSPSVKLDIDGSNYNASSPTTLKITDHSSNTGINTIQGTIQFRGRYWSGDDNTAVETKICSLKGFDDGSTGSALAFYTQSNGGSNSAERMRITSSGAVTIGTTSLSNGGRLQVSSSGIHYNGININNTSGDIAMVSTLGSNCNNSSSYNFIAVTGTGDKCYILGNGNLQNINNSYGALSDAKLKENIVDATPKLDKVMQLQVRNFNLIDDENKLKQIGFIAQEIEEVFPSIVEELTDMDEERNPTGTTTKAVKSTVLIPILVKAMQEQQAIIEELKSRIEVLEAK